MRLRGAMIDLVRSFTKYDRKNKTAPTMVSDEGIQDNVYYSSEQNLPSGIDFDDLINILTDREREVIIKHFYEDQECPEISEMLGISNARTHKLIKNAVEKFRKKLGLIEEKV